VGGSVGSGWAGAWAVVAGGADGRFAGGALSPVCGMLVAEGADGAGAFSPAFTSIAGGAGAGTAGVSLNGSVGDGTSLGMLGAVSAASVAA
jgi:hypothetical protein